MLIFENFNAMALISSSPMCRVAPPTASWAIRSGHALHARPTPRRTLTVRESFVNAGSSENPEDLRDPEPVSPSTSSIFDTVKVWWKQNQEKSKLVKEKLLSYGPAAVLAYGLFDGVSYSIAFAIAFLGYEARTGLNPVANLQDLVKICILMWAGNNVTRPFRLAGAAALAPFVDKVMEKLRAKLRLPNKLYSFFILTFLVASVCLSGVGLLIFSRWVQG